MSDRLVWLPFDPAELGEAPAGLRLERVDLAGGQPPDGLGDVEFLVPPYDFSRVAGDLLEQMTSLQVVQTLSAGIEHIAPAIPEGVTLCNGRGIHDNATAELAVTLVLASLRGVPTFARAQDEGRWPGDSWRSLAGKHVLIVGMGQIGRAIEARLAPFEVASVVGVARTARDGVRALDDLPDLLPEADVVIVMVAGTEQTRGMFDAALLARLKDGALLVNMARGNVVDTDALLAELESGRIHAALDVTEPEPLPEGHPLWSAPHLLVSMHTGGKVDTMKADSHRVLLGQLRRFAAGEDLENVITGDY